MRDSLRLKTASSLQTGLSPGVPRQFVDHRPSSTSNPELVQRTPDSKPASVRPQPKFAMSRSPDKLGGKTRRSKVMVSAAKSGTTIERTNDQIRRVESKKMPAQNMRLMEEKSEKKSENRTVDDANGQHQTAAVSAAAAVATANWDPYMKVIKTALTSPALPFERHAVAVVELSADDNVAFIGREDERRHTTSDMWN